MTVRIAKFVDIPRIVAIYQDAHKKSVYADTATIDEVQAKQMAARSIQDARMLVLVSETEGRVEGFIIGVLDSVYPCSHELMATDLLFICTDSADARDAAKMAKLVIKWGEGNEKVIEARLGVTGAVGDWRRTSKLYEHQLGMEPYGAIFRRVFTRGPAQ